MSEFEGPRPMQPEKLKAILNEYFDLVDKIGDAKDTGSDTKTLEERLNQLKSQWELQEQILGKATFDPFYESVHEEHDGIEPSSANRFEQETAELKSKGLADQ